MAELASGAVTSLLGVIRNEWQLLGRVGGDVQFIREEMESMNSFLMHLARTAPPGGEHDEQVRTWMNQVRVLANDCNNCIDLYLYRGNPDIHLGSDRLRRYLRWVPWFLQKMLAQHRAALELRELKERARDVGKRRLRYGVEVPKKAPAAAPGEAPAAAQGSSREADFVHLDDSAEDDGDDQVGTTATDASGQIRRALFGLYVREDYFNDLLGDWIEEVRAQWSPPGSQGRYDTQCVAFVVPSTESGAIARQALAVGEKHVNNTILVDIPSLHYWYALGPKNILYYILREIQLQQQAAKSGEGDQGDEWDRKMAIRKRKREVIREIKENIGKLKVVDKIKEIETQIMNAKDDSITTPMKKDKEEYITKEKINKGNHALGVLLVLLLRSSAAAPAAADEMEKKTMPTLAEHYDDILNKTAEKLKEHMEQVNTGAGTEQRVIHNVTQYAHILREVFPRMSSTSQPQQAHDQDTRQATTEATQGKNQIREIIDMVKQEILREVFMAIGDKVQEATKTDSSTTILDEAQVKKLIQEAIQQLKEEKPADKKQETGVLGGQGPTTEASTEQPNKEKVEPTTGSNLAQDQNQEDTKKTGEILDAAIKETTDKMKYNVQWRIKRQLDINGIVDKIKNHLKSEETLIILKVDQKYVSQWEQTRIALSLLPCIAVVMILTKTETNQRRAKEEYCYPKREPIDYSSLAALYHGIVLKITGLQKNEYNDDAQILHTILDKCEPNELCMKIFTHALYAKPKRSKEELHRLHNTLQAVLPQKSYRSIAMKMFKFSYRDMPKEYQSCLLYLAVFPRGHKIRRSTLIGRWVAEGMITTEDWRWSSSVQRAEQCFDALVTRGLVYSAEAHTSATGRVKSCMVADLVHEFITEIAKKQRIVEARLSHHLARHFSIFNDLHLRGSDKISTFLKSSSESSQWSRLKVLDLEGCRCFMENRRYLKNICNNIILLKYLSLRGTDINWLPHEINNLRELEVLDIQQTDVPESSTKDLLLLKLKRLLAGKKDPSPNSTSTGTSSDHHVLVPEKIGKMLDMEVLSNVRATSPQDLDGIAKLWQLRKLGVVVKVSHLKKLLQTISDLHECLRTLSITLDTTKFKDSRELTHSPKDNKDSPKVLERLSISGKLPEKLLRQFLDVGAPLIKVTLSNTSLSQKILEVLSKLSMLHCLKLRENKYDDNKLTFKKGEFEKLKYFLVQGSNRIEVIFEDGAARELEKIVLSFDSVQSITGVDQLPKLEELELNNNIKSSNNSGSVIVSPLPATSPPPLPTATTVANDPVLSTTTATDPAPSTPTVTAAALPSPSAPAASAVANNPIPSTATTSAATTIPSSSAATATGAANDPVLSTATTTNPTPNVPATTVIPSQSAPAATAANDTIPSTATATNVNPTPAAPPTPSATTTCPSSIATTASIPAPSNPTNSSNNKILFLKLLSDAKQIAKVTLCGTMLKQDDLRTLARMENIRCLVLLHESYGESQLDLNKDEFPKLNVLIVSCSTITAIKFESGSAPKLEKIIWTFTNMNSFSGIENLTRLKELEFTGDSLPNKVKEDIAKHKDRIHCTHYKPERQDQTVRSTGDEDSVPSCLRIWKDKGWCTRWN